ncbi:hypothetical protein U9M48_043814 [Paspalum notatum var. saurae]|uniref:Uncharacterized protein n=1 Tax=Paspalum notatum var. saurae TaxID=547442 RepID=A0AAQ3UTV4_PASNO
MCKRPHPHEMAVYPDVASTSASQQGAAKRPRPSSSADAGALVLYDNVQPADVEPAMNAVLPDAGAADVQPVNAEPINAVPLNAIAPPAQDRDEPPCLRTHVLPALRLRADLPAYFLGEKRVTETDLNRQQNRFRIPTDGLRYLREILTPEELEAANLLHDPAPRPRKTRREPDPQPQPDNEAAPAAGQHQQGEELQEQQQLGRRKKAGKVHGGYAVRLVDLVAGDSGTLLLSRWDSSGGTVVKGEGYMEFIRRCSFKEHDVVEIWAIKQRACPFPIFKTIMCDESVLHFLLVKKGADCRFCHRTHLQ